MKETTIERFAQDAAGLVDAAQQERILVTRDGRPVALLVGIEYKDEEDWDLQTSPEFWKMIEERRREPTVPLDAIKAELFADEQQVPRE